MKHRMNENKNEKRKKNEQRIKSSIKKGEKERMRLNSTKERKTK